VSAERAKDKIVSMVRKGFSPGEIHRACCEKWPDEPVSLQDVVEIVRIERHAR
jgi:hypothetical protein